jgi:hypothetical protein
LDDPSIAGANADICLSNIVFTQSRSAVRDVVSAGVVVEDGRHSQQEEITIDSSCSSESCGLTGFA